MRLNTSVSSKAAATGVTDGRLPPWLLFLIAMIHLLLLGGCEKTEIVPSDARPVVVSLCRSEKPPERPVFILEWRFRIAEGWHLYWDGLNDSGMPPRVRFDLPEGWSAGPLHWPAPERLLSPGGILDHVYHDRLILWQEIHWTGDYRAEFGARVEWVACRDLCVYGDTLILSDDAQPPCEMGLIDVMVPMRAERLDPVWDGGTLTLTWKDAERLEFMPATDCGRLVDAVARTVSDGDRLGLRFRERAGVYGPARGMLIRFRNRGRTAALIDIPAVPAAVPSPGGR